MNEHVSKRLHDIWFFGTLALIGWALFCGYVLMGAVNSVFTNQCNVIQDQALERAVGEALPKAVEAELAKQVEEDP